LFETPACATTGCTIATSWSIPAVVTPGTYTITYDYSGNYESLSGDTTNTTTTGTVLVNKQTPALGTVAFSPAASEPFGTSQAITISDTLSWVGIGQAPSGAVTFVLNGVTYTATCGSSSPATCSATVPAATIAALPGGTYPVTAAYATDTNYNAATGTSANFTITAATGSLALVANTSSGNTPATAIANTTLSATITPHVAGITVTFTNATTGATTTATTSATGVATSTAQASTAAGPNSWSATSTATSSVASATSNAVTVYYAGLLLSSDTAEHTFSVDPGMYDNPTIGGCTNSNNGTTCSTPYGIVVSNFTASTQIVSVSVSNVGSPNKAFSSQTNCPANGLASGATCNVQFIYDPPYGDGCTLGGSGCATGTFEYATWTVTAPSQPDGLGTLSSGSISGTNGAIPASSQLGGKALLAAGNSLTVSPTSLTFGPQAPNAVSATQNVTVTNTGSAALGVTYTLPGGTFTTTNGCGATLAAGAVCQIGISYTDSNVATDTGTLKITPASGSAITVNLTGTTANNNGLSLTTTAHAFGTVVEGTTSTFGLTVTNNSSTTATNTFTPSGSSDFTITVPTGCLSLAAGASCQITVAYDPTTTGAETAALTVSSNLSILPGGTGSGPYTDVVNFSGSGTTSAQFTATTAGHNFGTVTVGSTATAYGTTLTNSTGVVLTLNFGSVSSPFTKATNCGTTLAVNASCQLQFDFTPTATGVVQQVYSVSATNGSTTYNLYSGGNQVSGITLTGTGQ
jgi:hypothetical protein